MIPDRNTQYQAYSMASQTVPKTKQIVMLYDGAIRFMQQAKEAIQEKRIQDRFNLLVKASDVVVSLQNCLDHESGGDIAKVLHDFYSSIDMSILSIHRTNSVEMCDKVIENLKQMRGAWSHIDTHGQSLAATGKSDAEMALSSLQPLVTSDMIISQPGSTTAAPFTPPEGGLQVSA
jgi:flagellar protein FliS